MGFENYPSAKKKTGMPASQSAVKLKGKSKKTVSKYIALGGVLRKVLKPFLERFMSQK